MSTCLHKARGNALRADGPNRFDNDNGMLQVLPTRLAAAGGLALVVFNVSHRQYYIVFYADCPHCCCITISPHCCCITISISNSSQHYLLRMVHALVQVREWSWG